MYHEHYGLVRSPFEMTPDPAFLVLGDTHREGLATLVYAVRSRKGFVLLTGEVGAAYARIDYLLTGLPEKEALGLNVLEAQSCGVPVLAIEAPPFTETVAPGVTGLFYADPRADSGASFAALLARLAERPFAIDPAAAAGHLQKFSQAAFAVRVERLVAAVRGRGIWPDEVAACAS